MEREREKKLTRTKAALFCPFFADSFRVKHTIGQLGWPLLAFVAAIGVLRAPPKPAESRKGIQFERALGAFKLSLAFRLDCVRC